MVGEAEFAGQIQNLRFGPVAVRVIGQDFDFDEVAQFVHLIEADGQREARSLERNHRAGLPHLGHGPITEVR